LGVLFAICEQRPLIRPLNGNLNEWQTTGVIAKFKFCLEAILRIVRVESSRK